MWASRIQTLLVIIKRKKVWVPGLSVIIIAVVIACFFIFRGNKTPTSVALEPEAPSRSQLANIANNAVAKNLSDKDYSQAVSNYLLEVAQATNPEQAKEILLEAAQKIPDADIPWYLYDSLAVAAKDANDKTVEISSLQKALTKAEQPGSGAGANIIQIYKQELKALGVSGG